MRNNLLIKFSLMMVVLFASCGGGSSGTEDPGETPTSANGGMIVATTDSSTPSGSTAVKYIDSSGEAITLAVPQSKGSTTITGATLGLAKTVLSPESSIAAASMDQTEALPFSLLTITGTGFDVDSNVVAVLFIPQVDAITMAINAYVGTSTTVQVMVPPLISTSGAFTSGAVSVQVVQLSGTTLETSEVLTGLTISPLASVEDGVETGAVTYNALASAYNLNETTGATAANDSTLTGMVDSLAKVNTDLDDLAANKIQALMNDPSQPVTITTSSGGTVTLTSADLAELDKLFKAFFVQGTPNLPAASESVLFVKDFGKEFLPTASACPPNTGDLFTDQFICERQQYGEDLTAQGWAGLKLGFKIEFGFYSGILGGFAAASAALAGAGEVAVTGLQILWSSASSYLSAYATGSPSPSARDLGTSAAANVLDSVAGTGGLIGMANDVNSMSNDYDAVIGNLQTTSAEVATQTGVSSDDADLAMFIAQRGNANNELVLAEALDRAEAIESASGSDDEAAASVTGITFTSVGGTTAAVITPAYSGVTVQYSVSGTDGYYDSGSIQTDASGRVSFYIPAGADGVVDTISVTAVLSGAMSVTHYTW